MNKIIGIAVILGMSIFAVQAQAQVKFGAKAGANLINVGLDYADESMSFETKPAIGFHIGAVAELEINDQLGVQSGLTFTQKGYDVDLEADAEEGESVDGYDKTRLNYIQLPVNLTYNFGENFQVLVGPYVAVGIGGKNDFDYTLESDFFDLEMKGEFDVKPFFGEVAEDDLGDDELAYRALDFGASLGVAYKAGPVWLNLAYQLGLGNINPEMEAMGPDADVSDYKQSHRVATFSVIYFINQE